MLACYAIKINVPSGPTNPKIWNLDCSSKALRVRWWPSLGMLPCVMFSAQEDLIIRLITRPHTSKLKPQTLTKTRHTVDLFQSTPTNRLMRLTWTHRCLCGYSDVHFRQGLRGQHVVKLAPWYKKKRSQKARTWDLPVISAWRGGMCLHSPPMKIDFGHLLPAIPVTILRSTTKWEMCTYTCCLVGLISGTWVVTHFWTIYAILTIVWLVFGSLTSLF